MEPTKTSVPPELSADPTAAMWLPHNPQFQPEPPEPPFAYIIMVVALSVAFAVGLAMMLPQ